MKQYYIFFFKLRYFSKREKEKKFKKLIIIKLNISQNTLLKKILKELEK
jgi:hypothetical protein